MKVKLKNKTSYIYYNKVGLYNSTYQSKYTYVSEYFSIDKRKNLFIISGEIPYSNKFNRKVKRLSKLFLDDEFIYMPVQYMCFKVEDIDNNIEDIINEIKNSNDLFARVFYLNNNNC